MDFESIVFDDNKSVYVQIIDYIKKLVIGGKLTLGERIPSVREMAGIMKVNVNTMQRAYKQLEAEGITETKRGMGSYVTTSDQIIVTLKEEAMGEIVDKFITDMRDMGFSREDIIGIITRRDS
ncbi:MAG: GntR family transcriptional regulator [Clostridium sp.]|uniref:GntR family transcriptional regulator n=1 Tax=Clostridium sp. TaxID=1506 RepID=UPI002FCBEF37